MKLLRILAGAVIFANLHTASHAQSVNTADGWDYNIVDSTDEKWLRTYYAAAGGRKVDNALYYHINYSGVEGADGSRTADVDLDGDIDILTVYEESKALYVYENTAVGGAHLNAWKRHYVGAGCGSSEEAIFFDFDDDGYPDILCVATAGGPGVPGERIYAYRNRYGNNPSCNGSAIPSQCWQTFVREFGALVPQKDWYRLGGDMGSADFNKDHCPDIAVGSAGGEVGVLWCPTSESRSTRIAWKYERIWNVNDGEVQKLQQVSWRNDRRFLVWSVKDPNKGVFVSRYLVGQKRWSQVRRIVSDVFAMEFTTADIDGDGNLDLILPTRNDPRANGRGGVRVYWGDPKTQKRPWEGADYTFMTLPWAHPNCNGLRNENIAKGVAVGELIRPAGGPPQVDIAVMGRGCPFAANGILFYNSTDTSSAAKRVANNWTWRSLTNQTGAIMQDNEEQKWDSPQLADLDGDGDLDIVASDENGDWGDTFKKGICCRAKNSDPHDDGLGTVIFWNQ